MKNADTALISIIIPMYKVERYIIRCLKSVVEQTYGNIEIIMIDDRGGDSSLDIARNYLDTEGVRYKYIINEKNSGPSFSRNEGLKIAEGKYVFFLDADDCVDKYCISHLAAVMESPEYDAGIVMSDFSTFRDDSEIQSFPDRLSAKKLNLRHKIDFVRKHGYVWGALYRLDILREHNLQMPSDISYMEDNIWNIDYLEYVDIGKVFLVESAKYNYFLNSGSLSRPESKKIVAQKTLACLNYYENRFYNSDSGVDRKHNSEMIEARRYFRNCFFDELHIIDRGLKTMKPDKHKGAAVFCLKKILKSDLSLFDKLSEIASLFPALERLVYKIKFSMDR